MYDNRFAPIERYIVIAYSEEIGFQELAFRAYDTAVHCLKMLDRMGREVILIDNLVPEQVPF